jgi:diguanylate cyclase (GGDEF)-like protein
LAPDTPKSNNQKWIFFLGSFLLTLFTIYIDYLSGLEVHLTVLLLVPIYFATWYSGMLSGLLISIVSASSLILDPIVERKIYPHVWEILWNIAAVLIFFTVFVYLLARLKAELAKAVESAHTDNLTGLLNSRAFFEMAEQERLQAIRYGHPLTLCFLDLDNFKQVNDSLGHMTGDELLRIVARALRENIRGSDIAVRVGGDEFAVLFPETGGGEAGVLVAKLHGALNRVLQQRGWPVTASIGMLTFIVVPGTVKEMLHLADIMMYEAKKSGKNRVHSEVLSGPHPEERKD